MCIVSAVSGGITAQPGWQGHLAQWPAPQILELAEVIRRLDDIDRKLGMRDCLDKEKAEFLDELAKLVLKYKSNPYGAVPRTTYSVATAGLES